MTGEMNFNTIPVTILAIAGAVQAYYTYKLKNKTQNIEDVAVETHKLVNSDSGVQKKINATSARLLANAFKYNSQLGQKYEELALEAEKELEGHNKKQAEVDKIIEERKA